MVLLCELDSKLSLVISEVFNFISVLQYQYSDLFATVFTFHFGAPGYSKSAPESDYKIGENTVSFEFNSFFSTPDLQRSYVIVKFVYSCQGEQ